MKKALHFIRKTIIQTVVIFMPTLTFAQWSAPVIISPHSMKVTMNENMGPCIASSHDTLHVIWSDHRTKGYAIYYTRSIDSGHTWTNPVNITDTTGHASNPSIAVNGRYVHVVWWDTLKGLACSRYEHSLDGGNTWGTKILVDSNTTFWPGIAISGTTVLVSLNKQPSTRSIVYLTKSTDNGNTFGPEQQISTLTTGPGRSEDQSTATDGHNIYMCWNDNRNNPSVLEIYYRRSTDMGATWDNEVRVSVGASYSPMLCNDSNHVYVNLGFSSPMNAWLAQSIDSGNTFGSPAQVTTNVSTDAEAYPFMVCSGENLFVTTHTFPSYPWHTWVTQSTDRGATWSAQVKLGKCTGTSFVALTCPAAHVVWPDSNVIYYSRSSNADPSCPSSPTGIAEQTSHIASVSVYPNPVNNETTITLSETGTYHIEIFDVTGRPLSSANFTGTGYKLSLAGLSQGMYFVKIGDGRNAQTLKLIKQ